MKRDEPFRPEIKSALPPVGLSFRIAVASDRDGLFALLSERNPHLSPSELRGKIEGEIQLNQTDPQYRLFVADLQGKPIGLCRYFHSQGLPKHKLTYPAPQGWYCMGILVDPAFRRQGVARFLFQHRLESLKAQGADRIYSMVDQSNPASVRMHLAFGFEEVTRAPGFLHVGFEGSVGILFQMKLKN